MSATNEPHKCALLIGSPILGLQGVHHDITKMAAELREWGFTCDVLEGSAATRTAILEKLRCLVDSATASHVIAIYYTGHGGRYRLKLESEDTLGPATGFLVPYDIDDDGDFRPVLDLELGVLLHELAETTKNVTVILDCCYSAGMARDLEDRTPEMEGKDRSRALKERTIPPGSVQDALAKLAVPSQALHPGGHPDVVRVVATAASRKAFEGPQADKNIGGYFTHELCAALAEARATTMSWATIIGQVRERIMAHRRAATQRPEVEGPSRRLPFSLTIPRYDGEQSVLVYDGSVPWVRAGRVHGLQEGDEVEVRGTDSTGSDTVWNGRLAEIFDDSARLELAVSEDEPKPRAGNMTVVRTPTLRKTVRVDSSALGVEGLVSKLGDCLRLTMVSDKDPSDFTVKLNDRMLCVSGPTRVRRLPRPTDPSGVAACVADLDQLARSELLLDMLESNDTEFTLPWTAEALVTGPGRAESRALEPGETLPEGSRLYVELQQPERGRPTLYANVLDHGVSGRISLLSQVEPSGMQMVAQEPRWLGRRHHGGPRGFELQWPADVPKDGPGHEELIIVLGARPLDLRSLLHGPVGTRGTRGPQKTHGLAAPLRWTVVRMPFYLSPSD